MSAAPIPDNQTARPATVLVVEDEVLIRLMIANELRTAGFLVIEAANADEVMKVLKTSASVDLMVADIRMPGMVWGLQ